MFLTDMLAGTDYEGKWTHDNIKRYRLQAHMHARTHEAIPRFLPQAAALKDMGLYQEGKEQLCHVRQPNAGREE